MKIEYCNNCGKRTAHKRAVGAGTIIGGLYTLGFSWLAIPWYASRCIVCGLTAQEAGGGQTFHARGGQTFHAPGYPPVDMAKRDRKVMSRVWIGLAIFFGLELLNVLIRTVFIK